MIRMDFNSEEKILYVYYFGKITINDLIEYGNTLANDFSLPRELNVLTDVTKGEYDFKVGQTKEMFKIMRQHLSEFNYIKAAFIQTRPRETAMSFTIEDKHKINNYHHKIFSSLDAAKEWLKDDSLKA